MDKAYERLVAGEEFTEVRADYMDEKYVNSGNTEEIIEVDVLNSLLPNELKVDQFSEPIFTKNGYYIIKRLENPTLTEIKDNLGKDIKVDKENSYMRNYADSLKQQVQVYESNISKIIQSSPNSRSIDLIIARLNNYKMDSANFKKYVQNSFPQAQFEDKNMSYLQNIAKELTLQNYLWGLAKKADIENSSEYKKKEKAELAMFDQGWENFIISKVYNKIISEEAKVSEEEIQNYYDTHKDEFTEDGSLQPLTSVKYKIKYKLQDKKITDWFEKVKDRYSILLLKKIGF